MAQNVVILNEPTGGGDGETGALVEAWEAETGVCRRQGA